jgi:hypothetical protein
MFKLMTSLAQRFNVFFNVVRAIFITMVTSQELRRAASFTRGLTKSPVQLDTVLVHGV